MLYLNLCNRCQTVIRALSVPTKISFIYLPLFFTYITVAGLKLFNQSRLRLTLCGMWISVYSTCVSIFTPTWLLLFKWWTSFSCMSVWGIFSSGKRSKSLLRVQERITYCMKICLGFANFYGLTTVNGISLDSQTLILYYSNYKLMTTWVLSLETTSHIKIISLKTTRTCRKIQAMCCLFKLKVTRPSFFGGVPSYFQALWYPHLYFYRKSNT